MRRPVVAVVLASLVLVGAACTRTGSGEETTTGVPVSTTERSAASTTRAPLDASPGGELELVAFAAERSCTVESASFTMAFRFDGPSGPVGADAEGAFDTVAGRSRFALSYGDLVRQGLGEAAESELFAGLTEAVGDGLEVVTADDTVYVRAGVLSAFLGVDTPWAAIRGPEAAAQRRGLAPLGSSDPCDLLAVLEGVGEVTEVGREELDGVTTTHYRVVVDPDRVAEQAPAGTPEAVRGAVADLEVFDPEAEVWIGDDGIVRRARYTFGAAADTGFGAGSLTLDLFGVGAPVDIAVPPADQVTELDAAALGEGLFGPN